MHASKDYTKADKYNWWISKYYTKKNLQMTLMSKFLSKAITSLMYSSLVSGLLPYGSSIVDNDKVSNKSFECGSYIYCLMFCCNWKIFLTSLGVYLLDRILAC